MGSVGPVFGIPRTTEEVNAGIGGRIAPTWGGLNASGLLAFGRTCFGPAVTILARAWQMVVPGEHVDARTDSAVVNGSQSSIGSRVDALLAHPATIRAVIALGVAMRLGHYFYNRAFWRDECSLWISLARLSWSQLSGQLYYDNEAPLGFLYVQKAILTLAGDSEYVLRLLPMLAGVAGVPLFYLLAKRLLTPRATVLAVTLFAIAFSPIVYSAEVKPYSIELTVAIVIQLIAARALDEGDSRTPTWTLALVGGAALWFSFQSLFVLAAAGATFLLRAGRDRARRWIWPAVVPGVAAMASLAGFFAVSLERMLKNQQMQSSWAIHFWPVIPANAREVLWIPRHFYSLFRAPGDQPIIIAFLGITLFTIGAWRFWRARDLRLGVLVLPFILPLFASAIKAYPYHGRHLLLALPALLILMAHGVETLAGLGSRAARLAATAAAGLLVGASVYVLGTQLPERLHREDMRPLLARLQAVRRQGESLYVYHGGKKGFDYYGPRYLVSNDKVVFGTRDPADVLRLSGLGRVWVLVVRVPDLSVDNWPAFLAELGKLGTCGVEHVVTEADRTLPGAVALYRCDL